MLATCTPYVRLLVIVFLLGSMPGLATAEILLYDIEAHPKAWARATAGQDVLARWDLSTLPDFGVSSMEGTLTAACGGPIPPGFLPSFLQIDTSRFFPSEPLTLAFIGPSGTGAENTANAIVPNQAQDMLYMLFSRPVGGFAFGLISCNRCAGSRGVMNMTVLDDRGMETVFEDVPAPGTGHRYGILGTKRRGIHAITLHYPGADPVDPLHYFPGIQGAATVFRMKKGDY